jgi:ribosome maturation factor RimP
VDGVERKPVKEAAREIVEQGLVGTGYELVDVQFKSEHGKWLLTIFVDKPGGVTLDDCEIINGIVDPILDAHGETAGRHDYLIVSSPGLDRPIRTDADFRRNLGRVLDVKLYTPLEGRKEFTGKLVSFDSEAVCLEDEGTGGQVVLKRDGIAKAVQHIEF